MRGILPWITAAVVIIADRITKGLVIDRIEPGSWIEVVPGFALTHILNRGIAFSLFAGGGPLTRIVLHLIIFTSVVIIAAMVVRHGHHSRFGGFAFGLILGGAIGNLIDRIRLGYVTDFVQVLIAGWPFPSFNVADAAISVGAAFLIIDALFFSGRQTGG